MNSFVIPRYARLTIASVSALLLALVLFVFPAAPAQAHWELVETNPADGTAVEVLPSEVSLTFSGPILDDSAVFEVTDSTGASLNDGEATVADTLVSQPVSGTATGLITVVWKVTYSDGHPADGTSSFTVNAAPTPTETTPAAPTETAAPEEPQPAETAATEESGEPVVAPAPDAETTGSSLPWVIGGLLAFAAVGGAVLYLLVSRTRRQKALERARNGGSERRGER